MTKPKSPTPVLEDIEEEEVLLAAPDPLAEPLSAEEMKQIEGHIPSMDEQREAAFQILRKRAEVKLPVDPEAGDATEEATDGHLEVRVHQSRHKHRRRKADAPSSP